jgi:hypothetical protein
MTIATPGHHGEDPKNRENTNMLLGLEGKLNFPIVYNGQTFTLNKLPNDDYSLDYVVDKPNEKGRGSFVFDAGGRYVPELSSIDYQAGEFPRRTNPLGQESFARIVLQSAFYASEGKVVIGHKVNQKGGIEDVVGTVADIRRNGDEVRAALARVKIDGVVPNNPLDFRKKGGGNAGPTMIN